jgi:DNA-binding transcriptional ArsR family regulator
MMVPGGSMGARILLLLGERYPITVPEVALALRAREDVVRREVRKLQMGGMVSVEQLGEKEYVALTGEGITYLGLPAKEAQRLRERRLPPAKPRDEHDPAFG